MTLHCDRLRHRNTKQSNNEGGINSQFSSAFNVLTPMIFLLTTAF
jgi:hypothetical protein